ncbi:hypothetical protein N8500_04705 [Candidatus Puniceispirillum sp.]|nr:hypothetical protein [Candidatus Puniceispirillum sp.]
MIQLKDKEEIQEEEHLAPFSKPKLSSEYWGHKKTTKECLYLSLQVGAWVLGYSYDE